MPFTVAATPAMDAGSGTEPALWVAGANCEPKTVNIIPGEYTGLKDAPFTKLAMVGGVDETKGETVTVTEAVVEASPLHCAVIIPEPCARRAPDTLRVAVAVPPEPTRATEPSEIRPCVNVTVPVGVIPLPPATG